MTQCCVLFLLYINKLHSIDPLHPPAYIILYVVMINHWVRYCRIFTQQPRTTPHSSFSFIQFCSTSSPRTTPTTLPWPRYGSWKEQLSSTPPELPWCTDHGTTRGTRLINVAVDSLLHFLTVPLVSAILYVIDSLIPSKLIVYAFSWISLTCMLSLVF